MNFALINVQAVLGAKVTAVLVVIVLSVIGIVFAIVQPEELFPQGQVDAIRAVITHVTTPRDESASSNTERASLEPIQR